MMRLTIIAVIFALKNLKPKTFRKLTEEKLEIENYLRSGGGRIFWLIGGGCYLSVVPLPFIMFCATLLIRASHPFTI